jgi:hypothetical protein
MIIRINTIGAKPGAKTFVLLALLCDLGLVYVPGISCNLPLRRKTYS